MKRFMAVLTITLASASAFAAAGETRSDVEIAVDANDWNFIAPAL